MWNFDFESLEHFLVKKRKKQENEQWQDCNLDGLVMSQMCLSVTGKCQSVSVEN